MQSLPLLLHNTPLGRMAQTHLTGGPSPNSAKPAARHFREWKQILGKDGNSFWMLLFFHLHSPPSPFHTLKESPHPLGRSIALPYLLGLQMLHGGAGSAENMQSHVNLCSMRKIRILLKYLYVNNPSASQNFEQLSKPRRRLESMSSTRQEALISFLMREKHKAFIMQVMYLKAEFISWSSVQWPREAAKGIVPVYFMNWVIHSYLHSGVGQNDSWWCLYRRNCFLDTTLS